MWSRLTTEEKIALWEDSYNKTTNHELMEVGACVAATFCFGRVIVFCGLDMAESSFPPEFQQNI